MLLGRVVGTVVATRKEAALVSVKLMIVQPIRPNGEEVGLPVVAADAVGAGTSEVVLIAQGSSARMTEMSNDRPIDAVIMAIVDSVEIAGEFVFQK